MTALSAFADFVATTGNSYLTSADDLVNECTKNTYVLKRFMKGADKTFSIQGGARIKDTLMLDYTETARQYQPNDTFTYSNPQSLTDWTIDWRFTADHMSWTDQEIELQSPMSMTDSSLRGLFKKLKYSKEQRLWTSTLNYMENQLWALPSNEQMEAQGGSAVQSIPVFVNENTNGLYTTAHGLATSYTTVQTINPSTYSRWVPQQQIYNDTTVASSAQDETGAATPGTGVNVIQAFDRMFYKVKFDAPPTRQEYFENPKLYSQVIFTSRKGLNVYQTLLRNSQDRFTGIASYQDPAYAAPAFAGIDLQYVAALDTAALYTNGSNGVVYEGSTSATNQGPRYYWINAQYMAPVFHSSRYLTKHEPMRPVTQPFTTIVVTDSWWNMCVRSRQRHGIVYPNLSMYPY